MRVDAVLGPADIARLPARDLSGTVCVVFDVLRATTSLVTGFAHGMQAAVPVTTIEEALAERVRNPGVLLGGERFGNRIDGFDLGNSPLEYDARVAGRTVVTTTTNGTVALRACAGAAAVHAGALLNLTATARCPAIAGAERVLLVCAGTFEEPALEDLYAAGALAARLGPAIQPTDTTLACLAVHQRFGADAESALEASANGGALIRAGRGADLRWAAQTDRFGVVVRMEGDSLRRVV